MERYIVNNVNAACRSLDNAGIGYDFDDEGQIMVEDEDAQEAEEILEGDGIKLTIANLMFIPR